MVELELAATLAVTYSYWLNSHSSKQLILHRAIIHKILLVVQLGLQHLLEYSSSRWLVVVVVVVVDKDRRQSGVSMRPTLRERAPPRQGAANENLKWNSKLNICILNFNKAANRES